MSEQTQAAPLGGKGPWRAYSMLVLTTLCWGGNAVLGRFAVGEISPMLLVTLRWLGVLLLALFFLRALIREEWPALKPHLRFLVLMGATGFTSFNALFYIAAHYTSAINIGIIQGAMPVFVLIGSFLLYRHRINAFQLAGVLVTLVGVIIIAAGGSMERLAALAINNGDFLMLIACAFYAAYAVGLPQRPKASPLAIFAVMAAAAFVVSLPLAAAEAALGYFQWPTATGWLVVLLVTLFPSFLAQIFFIQGVDHLGPARAGTFLNLVPIFAAFLAVVLLSEPFELFHALALLLVLVGIWLSERFKTA